MIHAYGEDYLHDSMQNLGEAFDYAVNACGIGAEKFMWLFIASGYADSFGKGVPRVVAGLSGTELVMEILHKAGISRAFPEPQIAYDCSAEYWCGWILAYFQWETGRSFKDIERNLSVREILKTYRTLHEASEEKFVDTANAIISRKNRTTRLQRQRKQCGFTQKALSEKSGVKLRTLQQYEMRAKDINKASVSIMLALASALSCSVEDLLEYKSDNEELSF